MNLQPILSIIVPVYNAEKYIDECLDSLLAQGFCNGELEILCIDDGSHDNSLERLNKWADKNSCIRVISKNNGGVSSARNTGLENMRGKYFEFVDADDALRPDCMKKICSLMDEKQCDVAQFDVYNSNDSSVWDNEHVLISKMTLSGSIWKYIFSSDKFSELRFDESMQYAEDTLFAQIVALHAPRCLHVQYGCYVYRLNPNGVMQKRNWEKAADSMLQLAKNHQNILRGGVFPEQQKRIEIWCSRATAGYIYYRLRGGDMAWPFDELKALELWPYRHEWKMLKPSISVKQTLSNYCLFCVGFRPLWLIFEKTKFLNGK